jgi:hypothetical protein
LIAACSRLDDDNDDNDDDDDDDDYDNDDEDDDYDDDDDDDEDDDDDKRVAAPHPNSSLPDFFLVCSFARLPARVRSGAYVSSSFTEARGFTLDCPRKADDLGYERQERYTQRERERERERERSTEPR